MSRRLVAVLRSLLHGEVGLAQRGAQAARLQTLRPVMLGVIDRLESTAAGEGRCQARWWGGAPRRGFGSQLQQASEMPEAQYHQLANQTLDDLVERIEAFLDTVALDDGDCEYSQGVVTIRLGGLGTYVINKQTPNRQIWLSSPVSGPFRYDYFEGKWVYPRDGHHMLERLQKELARLTGADPDLSPCYGCGKLNSCQGELCR